MSEKQTFTGNRGLQLEEPLILRSALMKIAVSIWKMCRTPKRVSAIAQRWAILICRSFRARSDAPFRAPESEKPRH